MPINYRNYAPNWLSEIRPAILKRADHRCETCDLPNYCIVRSKSRKRLTYAFETYGAATARLANYQTLQEPASVIVLTIAHLDHDPRNNDPANLQALCQRCHLSYDAQFHAKNAKAKRQALNPHPELAL